MLSHFCHSTLNLSQSLIGMSRSSASLAIPHRKSRCHTNHSVKLSSFRHFQDRFLTTNREKRGEKNRPLFRKVCVFDGFAGRWHCTIRIRSRIARYNATEVNRWRPSGPLGFSGVGEALSLSLSPQTFMGCFAHTPAPTRWESQALLTSYSLESGCLHLS